MRVKYINWAYFLLVLALLGLSYGIYEFDPGHYKIGEDADLVGETMLFYQYGFTDGSDLYVLLWTETEIIQVDIVRVDRLSESTDYDLTAFLQENITVTPKGLFLIFNYDETQDNPRKLSDLRVHEIKIYNDFGPLPSEDQSSEKWFLRNPDIQIVIDNDEVAFGPRNHFEFLLFSWLLLGFVLIGLLVNYIGLQKRPQRYYGQKFLFGIIAVLNVLVLGFFAITTDLSDLLLKLGIMLYILAVFNVILSLLMVFIALVHRRVEYQYYKYHDLSILFLIAGFMANIHIILNRENLPFATQVVGRPIHFLFYLSLILGVMLIYSQYYLSDKYGVQALENRDHPNAEEEERPDKDEVQDIIIKDGSRPHPLLILVGIILVTLVYMAIDTIITDNF